MRDEKQKVKRNLTNQVKDPWKILRRLNKKVVMPSVLSGAANSKASTALLFSTFFPKSKVVGEKQKKFVEKLAHDLDKLDSVDKSFVEFTLVEIKDAILSLGCYKAPGPDGIPGVALHSTIDVLLPFWSLLFNSCGRMGYFPEFWKRDVTVVIPKPGKDDYSVPKAYRPISLLSQLGKTFERLLVLRVNRLHRDVGVFSENQHGFMLNRGCATALDKLLGHTYAQKAMGQKVMMMNLDVEGAFNRTWHCAILRSMLNKKVPAYIIHIIRSFLKDRVVRLNYGGNVHEEETPDGCPQGAVLSPLLFKFVQELVIDAFHRYDKELAQRRLLDESLPFCDKLLVNFADDSTLIFQVEAELWLLVVLLISLLGW